jgi:hypothetical protein
MGLFLVPGKAWRWHRCLVLRAAEHVGMGLDENLLRGRWTHRTVAVVGLRLIPVEGVEARKTVEVVGGPLEVLEARHASFQLRGSLRRSAGVSAERLAGD